MFTIIKKGYSKGISFLMTYIKYVNLIIDRNLL